MTTLLSAVNMVKFKPQTKPSWLGEEEKGPVQQQKTIFYIVWNMKKQCYIDMD